MVKVSLRDASCSYTYISMQVQPKTKTFRFLFGFGGNEGIPFSSEKSVSTFLISHFLVAAWMSS